MLKIYIYKKLVGWYWAAETPTPTRTCSKIEESGNGAELAGPAPDIHHEVDSIGLVEGPAIPVEVVRMPGY